MHAASRHWIPKCNVPSEGRRSELFWSFIWKVAHPVSDRTLPCLTSVKLMELAGSFGHSLHILLHKRLFNKKHMFLRPSTVSYKREYFLRIRVCLS